MSEIPDPKEIEEQKSDAFTRTVAMTVAGYAVALAITSLGGGNCGKDVMLQQQQSSNKWAYYQAKVLREHMYRIEKLDLKWQLTQEGLTPKAREEAEKLIAKCAEEEERYGKEKSDIEKEAKALEASRDLNMQRDPYFDYGEVLLQIAIVMASISMLSGSLPIYLFSTVLAAGGAFLSADGFFLFAPIL